MPRRKAAVRGPQQLASDYDTDTAGHLTDGTATHPAPARTNTELNLAVLRRYSPDISRLITIAAFAVVYTFSPETQFWEKCGIEGTLFVCQLFGSAHPRYQVIILNRSSLDNFIIELKNGEDVEITDDYVILQVRDPNHAPKVYGLWIFSDVESVPSTREVVAMNIQECAVRAEQNQQAPTEESYEEEAQQPNEYDQQAQRRNPETARTGQHVDLLSLLRKPQVDQDTHIVEPPPTSSSFEYQQDRQVQPSADTGLSKSTRYPAPQADQEAQFQDLQQQNTLLDLFRKAHAG